MSEAYGTTYLYVFVCRLSMDNYSIVSQLVSDARLLTLPKRAACRTIFHLWLAYHALRQHYE
jgi:hypothetical protein